MTLILKELNKEHVRSANYNSFGGKRGDLEVSSYESYAEKIKNWNILDEKKQKLLDELHKKFSEMLKYSAQHVSVMVAGPAKYNAKRLDKSDKILQLSSEFCDWFKNLERQIQELKDSDKATRIIRMIELWDSRDGYVEKQMVLSELMKLSTVDSEKFVEYFEKLLPKYNWRKNTNAYKLYLKHKAGEVQEVRKEIIFENADYTAYTEGERAYIKFTTKPQRQLIVALKSRKWWWDARESAWSTYLNKLDMEWITNLSEKYSKYI